MIAWLMVGWLGCSGEPPVEAQPEEPVEEDDEGGAAPGAHDTSPLRIDVEVDATDTRSGWLGFTATFRGVKAPLAVKRWGGDSYAFEDIRLVGDGRLQREGLSYAFPEGGASDRKVSWRARPGGEGRHGAQGWSDDRFAVFDGRALLLPIGAQPVEQVRFRFRLPEGWSVATALVETEDGWWVADPPAGGALLERLMKECHGVGPFHREVSAMGDSELRSFVHTDLDLELQRRVHDDTRAVGAWFHDVVGFDPKHPMAFVRTPSGKGDRIFGGASMMGACYEARYNERPDRNTYLLGHRFGHPMNRYPPNGLTPEGPAEHWYTEGWASWAEVVAAESSGRMPEGTYFAELWKVHLDTTRKHPEWDHMRFVDEEGLRGEQVEYAHYFRGPLAVEALAFLVEERSDTTLEAFTRHLWRDAGNHRRLYRLQEELEAFTGARFDDFWAAWVDGGLPMVPAFPSIVGDWAVDRAARPSVATTAGVRVHADDLRWLAASGRFHDFRSIARHVGLEGPRRAALLDRGVRLVPESVLQQVHGLAPATRWALVEAEAGWPVHRVADALPRLEPQLDWLPGDDADTWRRLLADEAADAELTLRGGIDRIALRVGNKKAAEERPDVLVVSPDESFTVYVWWREPQANMRLEVLHEGVSTWSADVVEEPGWTRNRLVVGSADRPAAPGRLTVKVLSFDGKLLGQRSFWQRAPSAP